MICVLYPLINKFTILEIEEYTIENSNPLDTLTYFSMKALQLLLYVPNRKKKLLLYLTINALNTCRALYFLIIIKTTELFFI